MGGQASSSCNVASLPMFEPSYPSTKDDGAPNPLTNPPIKNDGSQGTAASYSISLIIMRCVLARSIERFALAHLNRHADVLPGICGGGLGCHSGGFINRVRLNDNECASQLGDIQQRAITDHWCTIDRPYRLPFLIGCQRPLYHDLACGTQCRIMGLTSWPNRLKLLLRKLRLLLGIVVAETKILHVPRLLSLCVTREQMCG